MYINNPYARENLYRSPTSLYSITVNVAARTMTLYKNDQLIKTYPVGVGKPTDSVPPSVLLHRKGVIY